MKMVLLQATGMKSHYDEMLKFADQRAQESIVLSRNSGNSVVLQLLEYEGARLLQRNTPEDQLTALWRFWNASS